MRRRGCSPVRSIFPWADGTMMAGWDTTGNLQFFLVTASQNPHAVSFNNFGFYNLAAAVRGRPRGAMAFDPTNAAKSAGRRSQWRTGRIYFACGGQYSKQRDHVARRPFGRFDCLCSHRQIRNRRHQCRVSYCERKFLRHSQCCARPGQPFLPGIGREELSTLRSAIDRHHPGWQISGGSDQSTESATNGTLVAMPVDASGNVGNVGMTQGGFLATQNMDCPVRTNSEHSP